MITHPRVRKAILFATVGAVIGVWAGMNPNNALGMAGCVAIGAIGAFLAGLAWD